MSGVEALMRAEALSLAYNNQAVLKDVTLGVHAGRLTALMAPSGAGKSTLLRVLLGLESALRGTISVSCPAREIGVLLQETNLLPWLSAEENYFFLCGSIGLAPDLREMEDWLAVLKLSDRRQYFPRELSGGMRQKVALLRALLLRPRLLYLDEALDEVDEMSRFAIFDRLRAYCKANAGGLLCITHNPLDALHLCDEVLIGSSRPMTISVQFKNPLPQERDYSLRFSQEFFHAVEELSLCLRQQ